MEKKALSVAIRRLSAREYSSGGMLAYLKRKGFDDEEAKATVKKLVENRFIDDTRFAAMFVREQIRRGKGRRLIGSRLRAKGVALSDAELKKTVDEVSEVSELETAKEVLERRYPRYRNGKKEAMRALRGLLSRGFDYQTAMTAMSLNVEDEDFYK